MKQSSSINQSGSIKSIITWVIATVAVIGIVVLAVVFLPKATGYEAGPRAGFYDEFAQCIADSGAKFYGTFWCPHCQNQKKMFGTSAKLLPYTECSTPDGKGTLPVCTEAEIKSYPTWEFPDMTRLTGEVPLADLAAKTQCALPVEGVEGVEGAAVSLNTESTPSEKK